MATTNTRRSAVPRHRSALSAAREGWHKWASRHWGWFTPLLALVCTSRGAWKTIRWAGPKIKRRNDRIAKWLDRAAVDLLDRHRKTRGLAARLRKAARVDTGIKCSYCGAQLTAANAAAHIDAHNRQAQAQIPKPQASPAASSNVTPIRKPAPKPRNAPPPAALTGDDARVAHWVSGKTYEQLTAEINQHASDGLGFGPAYQNDLARALALGLVRAPGDTRPPRTVPIAATAPAAAPSTRTGGTTMTSSTGTPSQVSQLIRAAMAVGEMDPDTAWHLDAQLQGMSRAMLQLSEGIGQWIETLDAIKTDPRITAQAGTAVSQIAEVVATFATTRQLFRNLYAPQFAAAESGTRQVQRQHFFDPKAA